ncbi:hypothetical protein HC744_20550 [Arthrobacter sp. S1_S22]|nr:hypothetical protein [Arthrobacter sp. S1_S22]
MTTTAKAQLPNAIFLVLGSEDATIPDVTAEGLIWASNDALIIGGTNDMDGETTIHVSTSPPENDLIPLEPRKISSNAGKLSLETVYAQPLIQQEVRPGIVEIIVWVDDLAEPGIVHLQIEQ